MSGFLNYEKLSYETEQKIISDRQNGIVLPYATPDSAVIRREIGRAHV